jgi:hypothetical protein
MNYSSAALSFVLASSALKSLLGLSLTNEFISTIELNAAGAAGGGAGFYCSAIVICDGLTARARSYGLMTAEVFSGGLFDITDD